MSWRYSTRQFRKILVPVVHGSGGSAAVIAALSIGEPASVVLVGMVGMSAEESLSAAALPGRHVRKVLREMAAKLHVRFLQRIRASHEPWEEILAIVREEAPDLLVLDTAMLEVFNVTAGEALRNPPCDMVIAVGTLPEKPGSVLVSLRGGPYAELSLRLGLTISRTSKSKVTALHLSPASGTGTGDAAFAGMERVLKNLPDVVRREAKTDDPATAILAAAQNHDLLIVGATARPQGALISIGPVAERILQARQNGVLVAKSQRLMPVDMDDERVGQNAISILVDKWFAENTYHAGEFADLENLLRHKREQNLKISLALPALNEEETVGTIIRTIKEALADRIPLLDEIVLVDSASTDRTREIAESMGVPVHVHQEVLPRLGARSGKGEALWKSLYLTSGDIVAWIDTDIVNIHPRFVYGLLGPLILHPEIQLVKGFYRRPLKVENKLQAGGGRVTELTARPLLNLFFPELSGMIQPLAGEYAGRRTALEQVPFSSGYGVEIGLAIDIFEKFGLRAIAQVDLMERIHHNQPLESLSKMSFTIIQAVVRRIEKKYGMRLLEEVNRSMKLIRYGSEGLSLEVEAIRELERPAMLEVPEYLESRQ